MYSNPVGISVLTNGCRLLALQRCLGSLLSFCYYRPLVIGVFDNGSQDDTSKWLNEWTKDLGNPWQYGVTFRTQTSSEDLGCAAGTNAACALVRDCEFAVHIESDFEHLSPEESGEDRLWLRHAVEFMQGVNGNFMYLRRMVDERDVLLHWWSQWMSKIPERRGRYLSCPDFWWSNNPALRRNKALYDGGTLPLDTGKDGSKGTAGWSKPEMEAPKPGRAWIHQWGLFVHEKPLGMLNHPGCPERSQDEGFGFSHCKYGFFKNGTGRFCDVCDRRSGFDDMQQHMNRFGAGI